MNNFAFGEVWLVVCKAKEGVVAGYDDRRQRGIRQARQAKGKDYLLTDPYVWMDFRTHAGRKVSYISPFLYLLTSDCILLLGLSRSLMEES